VPIYRITGRSLFNNAVSIDNVYHYETEAVLTSAQRALFAAFLSVAWELLQPYFSTLMQHYQWLFQRVDVSAQPVMVEPWGGVGTGQGGNLSTPLPAQIAGVINFSAPETYPRRGRSFMGVFTEADSSGTGVPTTLIKTAMQTYADRLLSNQIFDGNAIHLVSVRYTGTPGVVTSYHRLTTALPSALWGTLKSRRQ